MVNAGCCAAAGAATARPAAIVAPVFLGLFPSPAEAESAAAGMRLLGDDVDPVAVLAQTRQYAFGPVFYLVAFALAFAIKVPMWPLHSWLPDAHVEAPTAGSVILAGVLLKMGTYGFLRFNLPLFPHASQTAAPFIAVLAIIGIIYGAIVSFAQTDVKKLVAYSSVSHLGFVMLGIFALNQQGIQGALLQMVNHGISTGALFLIVGILLLICNPSQRTGLLWTGRCFIAGTILFSGSRLFSSTSLSIRCTIRSGYRLMGDVKCV